MPEYQTTSFQALADLWPRADALFARNGVDPQAAPLRRLRAVTMLALECLRTQTVPPDVKPFDLNLDLMNSWFLLETLLSIADTPFEREVGARLRLVAECDPRFVAAGDGSNERDLLFEIVCGAVSNRFARGVRLLDPPDVVMRYGGELVGLACKQTYGSRNQTIKAIRKGMEQLARAPSTTGFVMVNLTSLFPHDRVVVVDPYDQQLWSNRFVQGAKMVFEHELHQVADSYFSALRGSLSQYPSEHQARCNGVIFMVQSVACVRGILSSISGTAMYPLTTGTIAASHFPAAFNIHLQNVR